LVEADFKSGTPVEGPVEGGTRGALEKEQRNGIKNA